MSDNPTVRATVEPYLTIKGAKAAIAWYEEVYGATCLLAMDAEDGERLMHATLKIGTSNIMLSDEFPEYPGNPSPDLERGTPVCISLTMEKPEDVDKVHALAVKKGANSSMPP